MADVLFQQVVGRLLSTYQASAAADEEAKLSRELGALPLGVAEMLWFFLSPDGRLLAFNLFVDEVTAEFVEPRDVAYGLRLGSERFPELEELLPARPVDASNCVRCAGTGWAGRTDGSRYACGACHGRGWRAGAEAERGAAPDPAA